VERIEQKYPRFPGLNLSWEVREGLNKHQKFYDPPPEAGTREKHMCPSLEAQIANLADEITYYSHDLDDGLDFNLITGEQLAELEIWHEPEQEVRRHFPHLAGRELTAYVIRCIIDRQVQDVISTSSGLIDAAAPKSAEDVRRHPTPLIQYSEKLLRANRRLRRFLYQNLYYHPSVAQANDRACEMLACVFHRYLEDPALLGEATARRVETEGLHRAVCDYLSGMTDRYLLEEYSRLFGTTTSSLTSPAHAPSADDE
jgi:dGTPase